MNIETCKANGGGIIPLATQLLLEIIKSYFSKLKLSIAIGSRGNNDLYIFSIKGILAKNDGKNYACFLILKLG